MRRSFRLVEERDHVQQRRHVNTESVDNYLKAILTLEGGQQARVNSKALAERLGVAPASVTNMLQKLAAADDAPVLYERHRGVRLTPTGRRRALEVVRHHRLLETFLYKVLDYPLDEVHAEAERLEHFISERFEERIAAKLGHPDFDPHGHGIPTLNGDIAAPSGLTLADVTQSGSCIVTSVADHDAPALRELARHGIGPGTRLHVAVSGTESAANELRVRVDAAPEDARAEVGLTRELAAEVRIALVPEGAGA